MKRIEAEIDHKAEGLCLLQFMQCKLFDPAVVMERTTTEWTRRAVPWLAHGL